MLEGDCAGNAGVEEGRTEAGGVKAWPIPECLF